MLPFSHGIPGLDVDKELTARSEAEVHRETVGDTLIDGFVNHGYLRTQLYGSWQLFEIILKMNYVIYFVWLD